MASREPKEAEDNDDGVREEDWSSHIPSDSNATHYETQTVTILNGQQLQLKCVSEMTLVEMMNLVNGESDGTGQRLWPGAEFFVAALELLELSNNFASKRILELGSGTGFAGLALLLYLEGMNTLPKSLTLTDNNASSLQLTKLNCDVNLRGDKTFCPVYVERLDWSDNENQRSLFDTIIGTDVVYDAGILPDLFRTVARCLGEDGGRFCLSHVPRASLPDQPGKIATGADMEGFIDAEAGKFQLQRTRTIRPCDLRVRPSAINDETALMIFTKR